MGGIERSNRTFDKERQKSDKMMTAEAAELSKEDLRNAKNRLNEFASNMKMSLDSGDIKPEQYQELIKGTVDELHKIALAEQGLTQPSKMKKSPEFTKFNIEDSKGLKEFSKVMSEAGFSMSKEQYFTGRNFNALNLPEGVEIMNGQIPPTLYSSLLYSRTPGLKEGEDAYFTSLDGNFPKNGSLEGASVTIKSQIGETSSMYFENGELNVVLTAVDEKGKIDTQVVKGRY